MGGALEYPKSLISGDGWKNGGGVSESNQKCCRKFVYKYCKQEDQLACINFKTISFLANSK